MFTNTYYTLAPPKRRKRSSVRFAGTKISHWASHPGSSVLGGAYFGIYTARPPNAVTTANIPAKPKHSTTMVSSIRPITTPVASMALDTIQDRPPDPWVLCRPTILFLPDPECRQAFSTIQT